jgi:hypothetical protein
MCEGEIMRLIKANTVIENKIGSSRQIGRALAEVVLPGDTIDFSGFSTVNNSFADEFIWNFSLQHSSEAIKTLSFIGGTNLIKKLLQRAVMRRAFNVRITTSSNPKIHRKSIDFLSELSA